MTAHRQPKATQAAPRVWLFLWALVLGASHPLAAAMDDRSVGSHRWYAPAMLSAPATSALALAGAAGLGIHLYRRRRADEKRRDETQTKGAPGACDGDTSADSAFDEEWNRRLAMWERRLGGDGPSEAREDRAASATRKPDQDSGAE